MICAHCGCENPDGIAYCRDCGMTLRAPGPRIAAPTPTPDVTANAPLPPAARSDVTCTRCQERNPVESHFCFACGASLKAAPPAPQPAPSTSPVVCARCRGIADPGADFCKFCGARLGTLGEVAIVAPAPTPIALAAHSPIPPHVAPSPPAGLAAATATTPSQTPFSAGASPSPLPYAPLPAAPSPAPSAPATAAAASPPAGALPAPPGPAPATVPPSRSTTTVDPPRPLLASTRPLHGLGEVALRARIVRIAKDGSEGGQYPIVEAQTDLGRAEGNIVLSDDPYLSPRHARILVRSAPDPADPPTLVLVDLGGVNGVYVRLHGPHVLAHGDLLLLGQQVLRFEAVTEIEGARGPAMQHGVLLFGSPAPTTTARLCQQTVEGLVRDVLYLTHDELVIGRETGDRTFPDDVFLSRRHAAIRRDGPKWVLHDLGSSNGTFIRISTEHRLFDGDQFRVGHHLFRVDIPAPGAS